MGRPYHRPSQQVTEKSEREGWPVRRVVCFVMVSEFGIGGIGIAVCVVPTVIALAAWCLFFIVYFCCMTKLPYDEFVLLKNKYTHTLLSDRVYHGGRHFLAFKSKEDFSMWPSFVSWEGGCSSDSSTNCQIEMIIDGKPVHIEVSFYFRVKKENVKELFGVYGVRNYELEIQRSAYQRVELDLLNSTLFTKDRKFLEYRNELRTAIYSSLKSVYEYPPFPDNYFELVGSVQIGRIDLADETEAKFEEEQVLAQQAELELENQRYDNLYSAMNVELEDIRKELESILLVTEAKVNSLDLEAETNITVYKLDVEKRVFNETLNGLNLATPQQKLKYLFLEKLRKLENHRVVVMNPSQTVLLDL